MNAEMKHAEAVLWSRIARPNCDLIAVEVMLPGASQFPHECRGRGVLLWPLPGECCVFYSYGTVQCTSVQATTDTTP